MEELRALASTVPAQGTTLTPYLDKVRTGAYRVTDEDVEQLKRAGVTEDEIFEATVAVAAAEGLSRLDAADRVLG